MYVTKWDDAIEQLATLISAVPTPPGPPIVLEGPPTVVYAAGTGEPVAVAPPLRHPTADEGAGSRRGSMEGGVPWLADGGGAEQLAIDELSSEADGVVDPRDARSADPEDHLPDGMPTRVEAVQAAFAAQQAAKQEAASDNLARNRTRSLSIS
jgi:hypothetical protein